MAMGLVFGLSTFAESAKAWDWNLVQHWAYEIEDRSDEIYERAFQEAKESDPDQESALELLGNLAIQADRFSNQVNLFPWSDSFQTRNEYHQLYVAYYRAEEALRFAHFSYFVNDAFRNLAFAMDRLRVAYNYSWRPDSWAYITWRDHWYFELRYRHHRDRWWPIYQERINRRRLARVRWEERWRHDQRWARWERDRRVRLERERRYRNDWDRRYGRGRDVVRPVPPRRDVDRTPNRPPRRDVDRAPDRTPRRDVDRGGGGRVQPSPGRRPPRSDVGNGGSGRDRGGDRGGGRRPRP